MLIILSGLPATGKTTIARLLAKETGAVHLRIDSIEQVLRGAGLPVDGNGYRIAHAIAEDNLRLGRTVVADCVNPWPLTRNEWRGVAERAGTTFLEVELVCTNETEHRRRAESRHPDIAGHRVPSWKEIVERDYREWDRDRTVIDTAHATADESARAILDRLR